MATAMLYWHRLTLAAEEQLLNAYAAKDWDTVIRMVNRYHASPDPVRICCLEPVLEAIEERIQSQGS